MSLLAVFSLRNRAFVALLTIVVALFGAYALTALRLELFPSLTLPNVTVVTSYPGASPDVVEAEVSTPIENAVQGLAGLEETSSTSSAGLSTVQIAFSYGTDLVRAEQRVELALGRLGAQLPDTVDPLVFTLSTSDIPVMQLAVTSSLDAATLAARLDEITVPTLQRIDGVGTAAIFGVAGERIMITPDMNTLAANGLSTLAIREALDANGTLLATGTIDNDSNALTVQAGARISSLDEIIALPLLGGNAALTIGEVADVALAANPVVGYSRVNGEDALTIAITTTPSGNTVEVSREITESLAELANGVGGETAFTVIFDQAPFIESSIEALATEGLLGLGFAVLVIFIFLFSVRSTLVAAISIPVSVLITFLAMLGVGYTMNVLTLGALTIAIGRVVDDSIVVIENIKRHLGLGLPKRDAVLTGVREVATAITASTVTTVAVFLPITLVGDITGELFRPFALTVTIALAASLLVALTIVPVLAFWFLPLPKPVQGAAVAADEPHQENQLGRRAARVTSATVQIQAEKPTRLQKSYLPVIRWSVRRPWLTITAAVLVLGGTLAMLPLVPTNFVGNTGQNTVTITQSLPAGASLSAKDTAARELESALEGVAGVQTVQVSVGSSGGAGAAIASLFGGGGSSTFSLTIDDTADQELVVDAIQQQINALDPETAGELLLQTEGGGFANDIEVRLSAPNEQALALASEQLVTAMRALTLTRQAESNLAEQQPYLQVLVDRDAAAQFGLSEIAVGGIVAEAMLPVPVSSVEFDGRSVSIYLKNPNEPTTVSELEDFLLPTPFGMVPLTEVATVTQVDGPASITTRRGVRTATVSITPDIADIGSASALVAETLATLDLPDGVSWSLGGVSASQQESFEQLGLALLAAILIVYTVMVATFRSLRQPLLLLVSVPFAATGAILLQLASGIPLGVASLIGLLMLIGIVVTNAIVLIDLVNQYRDRGMQVSEAIVQGASRRLRPILMTAFATIFALVPMAVGLTGGGGFISQPLAITVIGGLVSSTLLTLVVLPSLYSLVEGAKERRGQKNLTQL